MKKHTMTEASPLLLQAIYSLSSSPGLLSVIVPNTVNLQVGTILAFLNVPKKKNTTKIYYLNIKQ
ncbi:protein of unknown function [Vibrio tapetis subsp. tapetis]|uniref:Uncharacterized protein n=1 Tax=Vibrio tapetis subsp. tapetis TaxID=1671868 RepID=A0A2N8ZBT4_9VIBR|nr:protein of unknown function [Vibrio tapetis subsp. tapetis]